MTRPPGRPAFDAQDGAPPPWGPDWSMFDPAPVAMAVTRGPRHTLAYTNRVYREVFGDRPLGQPLAEAFADLREREYFDLFDRVLDTGEAVSVTAAPVRIASGPGEEDGRAREEDGERFFTFSLSALTPGHSDRHGDGEGRAAAPGQPPGDAGRRGVLVVAVDVTEQVRTTERARQQSEERRRALRRYESLAATGTRMMWVTAAKGGTIEPSPGWEEVTGQSWEEFRGDGWLDALHPHDRAPMLAAWRRALEEVPEQFEYVYRLRTVDGTYRHFDVKAVPVREGDTVVEWVGTCTDIEQQWREQRRRDLLAHAAAVLAEATQPRDALTALGEVIVPALADKCGIYLLPAPDGHVAPDGPITVERIATRTREGFPPELPGRREERLEAHSAFARAIRERRTIHATFTPQAIPPGTAPPATVSWLERAGAHSMVIVPIVIDGTLAAVVDAFACGDREPIGPSDVALMREFLEQAHEPLRHIAEFQRTRRVALALQHSLLTEPPQPQGLRITARYLPSPTAAEVGGDWYDSFVLPDGAPVMVIGDVAGHDIAAAVTMSKMRNMMRGLATDRQEPPGDIIRRLDRATQTLNPEEGTATCALARLEKTPTGGWQAHYSVAGHPPPLLIAPGGRTRFLDEAGSPLLGLPTCDDWRISAVEPLPAAGTLLLYTDGLVERPDEDIDQGLERLRRAAALLADEPLDVLCDTLLAEPAATGRDDICLIALRVPDAAA
ncbi:SpoIIE family protein phosphatase [Streptomyces sp. ISL-11]|uniref:SpoIIE family protein phosphatase n=1 Tax=Streptomyces sp. ISL-11 TaxID=2819174 RepID=UPI001BEC6F22|nr:SpoIIE family protein phosphatase [Streptomyces sp. ISL-11]MBT2386502.1 SpoIIE family protein phosphatase [Streptomyces sp. ISL-11]